MTTELVQTILDAKEPVDLVSTLCSVTPSISGGRFQCRSRGLAMFGLPEVLAETEKGNRQQAAQIEVAVPSIVMYLVQRGEAIPDGNTCSIPNGGSYRIASEEGMMRLNPIEAPPGT